MNSDPIVPQSTKLLLSTQARYELDAASEVWHCLYVTGISDQIDVYFIRSKDRAIGGLIAIVFEGDPIIAVRRIREYLTKKPWILKYTLKIIPVEIVTNSLEELKQFVRRYAAERIASNDSWKIRISKHASKAPSRKIIDMLAKEVQTGKVSLETPDWIINIEIIRDAYLAAIIRPTDIIRKKEFIEQIEKTKLLEYVKRSPHNF